MSGIQALEGLWKDQLYGACCGKRTLAPPLGDQKGPKWTLTGTQWTNMNGMLAMGKGYSRINWRGEASNGKGT